MEEGSDDSVLKVCDDVWYGNSRVLESTAMVGCDQARLYP